MPTAFRDKSTFSDRQQDSYWSLVSDLLLLIERTRPHERIRDLAGQAAAASESSDDVLVLDEVPPEMPANADLTDCNLRLREALYLLLEARPACSSPCRDRIEEFGTPEADGTVQSVPVSSSTVAA